MENGVKTNTYHWELSPDGKIFTATATVFRPGGSVIMGQLVAKRISGSDGFAGEWKETTYSQPPAEFKLSLDSRYLHISYPSLGHYVDAPLDGGDAAVYGPLAPEGLTYSVRLAGRHEIYILKKRNGEPVNNGTLMLNDDEKVVTESWWVPGRLGDKNTFVYDRE